MPLKEQNIGEPGSSNAQKTQEVAALKKTEKKSETKKQDDKPESTTQQTATAATAGSNTQSSSTPESKEKTKLNRIDLGTKPEDTLDTFQNRNLAPAE